MSRMSLLKNMTSWKYQRVAPGMDKNMYTGETITIIRYLNVEEHAI